MNFLGCPTPIKLKAWDDTLQKEFPPVPIERLAEYGSEINWYKLHLMPFIGHKDCNGEELYADDIVNVTFETPFGRFEEELRITYDVLHCGYIPFSLTFECEECDNYLRISKIEKIGNFYTDKRSE